MSASPPATASPSRKVLWIVMENRTYGQIVGNTAQAPYINGTLLTLGGNATNMHSESRPSLPNYIAMTTGSTQGLSDDRPPKAHPLAVASIFSQADPWRAYEEGMLNSCQQTNGTFAGNTGYVVHHNPPAYLVAPPLSAPHIDCSSNDVPLGTESSGFLQSDLSGGTLPAFAFVTPGLCHDMHQGPSCSPKNPITAGDTWLSQWMPKIFAGPDYTSGRLAVFLTWDEGSGGAGIKGMNCQSQAYLNDVGCHIPTLIFSQTTVGGSSDGTYFDHYSMLKTTEELLALSTTDLGPNVATANDMLTAFNL